MYLRTELNFLIRFESENQIHFMKHLVGALALLFCTSSFSQNFYAIDNITEIKLYFDDLNWDATMDAYYANDLDELLFGSALINGENYDSVGVTYKGNSTYNENNDKNPLKIKLTEVYPWQHIQGYETIKLSNGKNDPSFVREVLSYEIGRNYMDMPLSNYAKVYINDDYYGLFSSSESINKDYMQDHFYCDRDNVRIKCNPESVFGGNGSSLEYLGADSTLYFDYYELKSDFGWNELVNFTNVLENNFTAIESVLDVDRALWMLAFNNVLANLDSYTGPFRQNYYMIQDDHGRFMPIVWDLNECIGGFEMVNSGGGPPGGITDLTEMDPFIRETDATFPLIYQLFSNPTYRRMYIAHCKTILEEQISNGAYYNRAQELQSIIDAEVQADPNAVYTHNEFTINLDDQVGFGPNGTYGVSEVLDGRAAYLSNHAAFTATAPTITNVASSDNQPVNGSIVTITANVVNATYVYLGSRNYKADPFQKIEMFDDGLHNDGAALDGVYGADLIVGAEDIHYYIYAENNEAGIFSPQRAEHEFYELTITSGVVINEVQSSNSLIAADQDGEYDDWIEFYNNSSSAVDLSGYYLTDDAFNMGQWTFPAGTIIGANDYLIVWCDKDTLQTGLHTNFKLSSAGETIYFSDNSMNLINQLTYPEIMENHSYGRFVNGTGGYIPMIATHNSENSFTALSLEEVAVEDNFMLYPNPTTASVVVAVSGQNDFTLLLLDMSGRTLEQIAVSDTIELDLTNYSTGTYIVKIKELNLSKKVVKY